MVVVVITERDSGRTTGAFIVEYIPGQKALPSILRSVIDQYESSDRALLLVGADLEPAELIYQGWHEDKSVFTRKWQTELKKVLEEKAAKSGNA